VRVFWTGLAIVVALLVQSSLSRVLPAEARVLDPFLLVVVYCALVRGEFHGMLAGAAAGWVQDAMFGGRVLGISGLAKLLVGYAVGIGAGRFLIATTAARALVVMLASVADALLLQWLASVFSLEALFLPPLALATRATLSALIGGLLFALVDQRLARARA